MFKALEILISRLKFTHRMRPLESDTGVRIPLWKTPPQAMGAPVQPPGSKHDARVSELLAANNAEVAKRRRAAMIARALGAYALNQAQILSARHCHACDVKARPVLADFEIAHIKQLIDELGGAAPVADVSENGRLRAALQSAIKIAHEARLEWDRAPAGMRAGKILIALSGGVSGYRADIDEIHAALNGG